MIHIPVSYGELIDKITILEIKKERIKDQNKLVNIDKELTCLLEVISSEVMQKGAAELYAKLKEINVKLWDIEDAIRASERRSDFGPGFVQLARAVYYTNDDRSEVKRQINGLLGSDLTEEKSYTNYKT